MKFLPLLFVAVALLPACENRDPVVPTGVVEEVLAPISGQIRPGNCGPDKYVVTVRTQTTEVNPLTGEKVTVGNIHSQCHTPEEAGKYRSGDAYP